MRDCERVTRRDGIAVADGKSQGIRCDDPASVHRTKRAFGRHAAFTQTSAENADRASETAVLRQNRYSCRRKQRISEFRRQRMTGSHAAQGAMESDPMKSGRLACHYRGTVTREGTLERDGKLLFLTRFTRRLPDNAEGHSQPSV